MPVNKALCEEVRIVEMVLWSHLTVNNVNQEIVMAIETLVVATTVN